MNRPFTFDVLRKDLVSLFHFLKVFFKKPLSAIQLEPEWDYQKSITLLVGTSLFSALLSSVFQGSVAQAIVGFLMLPLIALGMTVIMAVLLSYVIQFVHHRRLEPQRLFQVVVIAFIPFLLLRIFREYAAPVTLIGLAATCALMIVGLTERFQLPRRSIIKIISVFFALYFVYWGVDRVRKSNNPKMASQNVTEESIRLLDEEFKKNSP